MKRLYLILPLLLTACSPSSLEDFQREGESLCSELVVDLQEIQTREDLLRALPKLKKRFNELVQIMIQARSYQELHSEEEILQPLESTYSMNLDLIRELQRIYQIEGGQELVEKAEREALIRLDGHFPQMRH